MSGCINRGVLWYNRRSSLPGKGSSWNKEDINWHNNYRICWNFRGGFNFAIFTDPCFNHEIKTVNISFSNPHTSILPITGDQHVSIHVVASNNAIVCTSNLVQQHSTTCAPVGFGDSKIPRKFRFVVFGANPRNIFPAKNSTYMVYDGELCWSAIVQQLCLTSLARKPQTTRAPLKPIVSWQGDRYTILTTPL